MNDIKLTENFSLYEFECKDGSHLVKLDGELLAKLQKLRDRVKQPITIISGYRTPEYNKKVGGSTLSQHMEGKAADIKVRGMTPEQVAKLCEEIGFRGIGIYPTFVHVDTRLFNARWRG
jgi:uncharacterized protein YcbK (DUF882 family)